MIRRAVPALLLVAGIVSVHALAGGRHLTAHHDNLDGAAPLRVEAARQWKSGQVPLWNPYKRAGMPLLADTTAGAMYPGNLPFLWMAPAPPDASTGTAGAGISPADADAPVFRTLDRIALLHAIVAGLSMFLLLRTLALDAASAAFGGLVYACSGTMGWMAAWYIQIQNSAAWLPLVLAAVHRAAGGSRRATAIDIRRSATAIDIHWIAAGAIAVAMQWLAGFPETFFYTAVIALAYTVAVAARDAGRHALVALVAIYTAGALLAAVQLFPALELAAVSRRPPSLSLEAFHSLPARASMVLDWIVPSLAPGLGFPPAAAAHFGAPAVVAALLAIALRVRGAMFFAVLLAIGFALSIGDATPLGAWLWHVPGFSAFRHPFKHLFEVSFAMAALAALGASWLRTTSRLSSRMSIGLVTAAAAATAASLAINHTALVRGNPASVDLSGRVPGAAAVIGNEWRLLTPRHFSQKRDPAFLLGDYATGFEVRAVHGAGPFLWSELAAATGMVEEETTFRRTLFGRTDRTLALLSCRYVMQTRRGEAWHPPLDASAYELASSAASWRLMERKDALPRYRFVGGVECAAPDAIRQSLQSGTPDPAATALVDCGSRERSLPPVSVDGTSVEVTRERPGHIALAADVPEGTRAFLVIGQSDFPGWHARAGDSPVPIWRVHGLVQGIELDGGTTRVELDYRPRSFVVGAATSALTLVLLAAAGIAAALRRRNA